jgi:hypothetical protein
MFSFHPALRTSLMLFLLVRILQGTLFRIWRIFSELFTKRSKYLVLHVSCFHILLFWLSNSLSWHWTSKSGHWSWYWRVWSKLQGIWFWEKGFDWTL